MTFDVAFAFAGAIDLGSATITIHALLKEEGGSGAGELVEELPIVLQVLPGGGSTAAIFETPSGVTPRVTAEVQIAPSSRSTIAITFDGATIARFPELCATATPPATTLTTRFTIDDGVKSKTAALCSRKIYEANGPKRDRWLRFRGRLKL